jgi:actin-like ATPase involved in cell morphogenesis
MDVKIETLRADVWPPVPGTVVVRDVGQGCVEVRFASRQGTMVVYSSSLGSGDDFQQAIDWAVSWAGRRGIGKIYVEGEPDGRARERLRRLG